MTSEVPDLGRNRPKCAACGGTLRWEGPRVLGMELGPSEGAVRDFHHALVRAVAGAGQPVKERTRYQPHVALAKTGEADERLRTAMRALSRRDGEGARR